MDYSILILNYNGAKLLESAIPHTLEQMKYSSFRGELIVVDNCSSDDSRQVYDQYLSAHLRWISYSKNRVLLSYNEAVKEARGEIVILLNNDEWIDQNFIEVLVKEFKHCVDDRLFCVIPKSLDQSKGEYQGGLIGLEFKDGHYWINHDYEKENRDQSHTVVTGCLGAYNRKKFLMLEGFEPLLYPFYWEDTDLAYRASKRGWRCLYKPEAISYHQNQATIARFSKWWINLINRRNKLLFFYLNCNDKTYWRQHFYQFPIFILKQVLRGQFNYLQAWSWCILNGFKIYRRRKKRNCNQLLPDSALI